MNAWPMRLSRWLLLLALLSGCGRVAGLSTPTTSAGSERFFPETGHRITQPFLDLYQQIPEAERVLGYPITDAVPQPNGGQRQYFQNFVLEADAQGRVQILTLGEVFYNHDGVRATPAPEAPPVGCLEVTPGSPPICHLFLDFYRRHGGEKVFGLPISPSLVVDGWTVQYFQTARLEFHPEAPPGQQVRVSALGERYFRYSGENLALLAPQASANLPLRAHTLHIQAHAASLVAPRNEPTPLYITVADETGQPVAAEVELTLQAREQGADWQPLPGTLVLSTNAQGTAQWVFTPEQFPDLLDKTWVRFVFALHGGTHTVTTYLDLRLWPSP